MKRCILNHPGCEGLTSGSVGAAGIRWGSICQPCKDLEDRAVADSLMAQSRQMDQIMDLLLNPKPITEVETIA